MLFYKRKKKWKLKLVICLAAIIFFFGGMVTSVGTVVAIVGKEAASQKEDTSVPNFNTGGSSDIVKVALTQKGNIGGAKFWSYLNFPYRVAWCAAFVSWCANECGYIQSGLVPKSALCDDFRRIYKSKNLWQDSQAHGGNYTPKAGDFIVFQWDGSSLASLDHIGIVVSVQNNWITTIEGNTSDMVAERGYSVNDVRVIGYCTPDYPKEDSSGSDNDDIDFQDEDLELLAHIIECEAGADYIPDEEQLLVGSVVLNRVKSSSFPNTIREVIYAPNQYAPTFDGRWETNPPRERAYRNAKYLMENGSIAPDNVLYQATSILGTGIYKSIYHPELKNTTYICYG